MANYYVDATLGDDSNPGTITQPWKTVSKVNSTSFSAGDNIYFKRSEIWRETLTVPSSGSDGNLITFGAYGTGDRPKITGADIETGWEGPNEHGAWRISGSIYDYQVLLEDGEKLQRVISSSDGANLDAGQWGGNSGYIYYKPSSGTPDDHTVELGVRKYPLYINGKSYVTVENIRFEANKYETSDALQLWAVVALQSSNSCEISNCEVYFGGYFGISLNDCTGCVIENNEVTYVERRGITIGADCSDVTVSFNYVHYIGKKATIEDDGTAHGDKEGIAVSSNGSTGSLEPYNVTIEYNRIYDIGNDLAEKSTNCKGIVVYSGDADSGNVTGIIIRYNKVYNCDGRGISLENVDGNHLLYYNIVFNNGIGDVESTSPWGGILIKTLAGATSEIDMFNNVIWKNDGGPGTGTKANLRVEVVTDSTLTLTFKNNIIGLFQNSDGYDMWYLPSGTLNLVSDYNLFYEDSGSKNCIYWYGNTYDYDHVLGNESGYWSYDHSQDSYSITQDPLFVDADYYNFHLQPTSPCIDAGVSVGLTEDYEGNSVPWGEGVDIGAYERTAGRMKDYLDFSIPDYNYYLPVEPQETMVERGEPWQEVLLGSGFDEKRIDLGDVKFYVTLKWPTLTKSESNDLFSFYLAVEKSKTFRWQNPKDGYDYVVRFDIEMKRAMVAGGLYSIEPVRLKVLKAIVTKGFGHGKFGQGKFGQG